MTQHCHLFHMILILPCAPNVLSHHLVITYRVAASPWAHLFFPISLSLFFPPSHTQNIKKKFPLVLSRVNQLVDRVAAQGPTASIDVDQAALRVTLDVIGLVRGVTHIIIVVILCGCLRKGFVQSLVCAAGSGAWICTVGTTV